MSGLNIFNIKYVKLSNLLSNLRDYIYCVRKELYIRFKYKNLLNPREHKRKTDKVFILAGGASIAHINDTDWEHISKFDTAALNYFYVHDFVPDYLFVEMNPDEQLISFFIDNCINSSRYDKSSIMLQYKHAEKTSLVKNKKVNERVKYFVPEKLSCSSLNELRFFWGRRSKKDSKRLVHHSSHVGALIDYCVKVGYKDIVLLGVDLNGSGYFYQEESASSKYQNNSRYELLDKYRKEYFKEISQDNLTTHQSNNKELTSAYNVLPIEEYLKFVIPTYKGTNFYVYNSDSKLTSFLSMYRK